MAAKVINPIINGTRKCNKCLEIKDISDYHKARYGVSTTCKACKSLWSKEYRQKPEVQEKNKIYYKTYRAAEENKDKLNEYNRKRNKLPKVKETRNSLRRAWTLKQKLLAIAYKGGKCVVCGYDYDTAALDFHHLNPSEKEHPGFGAIKEWNSFEKNKPELDKCILVCCRCHRELHSGKTIYETT